MKKSYSLATVVEKNPMRTRSGHELRGVSYLDKASTNVARTRCEGVIQRTWRGVRDRTDRCHTEGKPVGIRSVRQFHIHSQTLHPGFFFSCPILKAIPKLPPKTLGTTGPVSQAERY